MFTGDTLFFIYYLALFDCFNDICQNLSLRCFFTHVSVSLAILKKILLHNEDFNFLNSLCNVSNEVLAVNIFMNLSLL